MEVIGVAGCGGSVLACSKVSTPGVTYRITFYMTNDIAINSKLYIQFPNEWPISTVDIATAN